MTHRGSDLFDQVTAAGLKALTPSTITDPERLRSHLAEYRRTGFALVNQETSPDAQAVAAAVFGPPGEAVAALSVVVAAGTVNLNSVVLNVVAAGRGITGGLNGVIPRRLP